MCPLLALLIVSALLILLVLVVLYSRDVDRRNRAMDVLDRFLRHR